MKKQLWERFWKTEGGTARFWFYVAMIIVGSTGFEIGKNEKDDVVTIISFLILIIAVFLSFNALADHGIRAFWSGPLPRLLQGSLRGILFVASLTLAAFIFGISRLGFDPTLHLIQETAGNLLNIKTVFVVLSFSAAVLPLVLYRRKKRKNRP